MAVVVDEEWEWTWVGEGRPDSRPNRGRVYFDKIRGMHSGEELERIYKVGDVVVMNGEQNERWFAQIVELFQVRENDNELREILHMDSRRNAGTAHYELMRCTLRWFYNVGDVSKDALRRSRIPKPIDKEVYFSDHVEKDGYNDVTVIEGLAFAVGSAVAKEQFLREPPERYVELFDHVCIVRCFINSSVEEPVLRNLDKGELNFLLQNPTSDKDLFSKARQRMMGKGRSKDPVMKSLSKKRRRTGRPVISFDDDEVDPEVSRPRRKAELKLQNEGSDREWKAPTARDRRRKHVVSDDDEDGDRDLSDGEAPVPPLDLSQQQAQNLNDANDEVMNLVTELNAASASMDKGAGRAEMFFKEDQATAIDVDQLGTKATPFSSKRRKVQSKRRAHASETIVIETDDSADEAGAHLNARRGNARGSQSAKVRSTEKPRPSFMPTARKTAREMKQLSRQSSGAELSMAIAGKSRAQSDHRRADLPADSDEEVQQDITGLPRKRGATSAERRAGRSNGNTDASPPRRGVTADPSAQILRSGNQNSSKDRSTVSKDPGTRTVTRDPTHQLAKQPASASKGKSRHAVVPDPRRSNMLSPTPSPVAVRKEPSVGKLMERMQLEPKSHPSKKQKNLSADDPQRRGTTARNNVESDRTQASDEDDDSEWLTEVGNVLTQLKTEFDKIPVEEQELLSAHVEFVFDMAVKKVTERGLSGDMDLNDERIGLLVSELLDELRQKQLDERDNSGSVKDVDGIRV